MAYQGELEFGREREKERERERDFRMVLYFFSVSMRNSLRARKAHVQMHVEMLQFPILALVASRSLMMPVLGPYDFREE